MGIGQSCERGLLRNLKIYLFLEQENIISEAAKNGPEAMVLHWGEVCWMVKWWEPSIDWESHYWERQKVSATLLLLLCLHTLAKCNFFTRIKIWHKKLTLKSRKSRQDLIYSDRVTPESDTKQCTCGSKAMSLGRANAIFRMIFYYFFVVAKIAHSEPILSGQLFLSNSYQSIIH